MATEKEPVQLVHIGMEPLELDHIGIAREPDIEPERRRRPYGPRSPTRDRATHGATVRRDLVSATSTVETKRQELGIDPERLLVVEFRSWDESCRDIFEDRFGAHVVDERLVEDSEGRTLSHVKVQFPSRQAIANLEEEIAEYRRGSSQDKHLPPGLRNRFLDAMEKARPVARTDRIGQRLGQEGMPQEEAFYLDVDQWHPGTSDRAREAQEQLRQLCNSNHGHVTETLRTNSLILARIQANRALAEKLLDLDTVAQVNLPPVLPAVYESLLEPHGPLPDTKEPTGTEPVVTVIDSGVLSGHPLLRGWILDEYDFDSGEETPVDRQGHGTSVAGLAVYGSVARCLELGTWTPEVLIASAKVLRRDPISGCTMFPDDHRPEALVERAIRHYHDTHECRVFNLSLGNGSEVYAGGRQFAWAELLDQLARELNIVIVVAAGNHTAIPTTGNTRDGFQRAVRDGLLDASARLCNPATAAIAVTVGSLARSEAPSIKDALAGSPSGAPSPFSRTGPGYASKPTNRAVKPEFVAYGGNLALMSFAGNPPRWSKADPHLGEPTTRLPIDGDRLLTAASGTSVAAPQVSHAAAWALDAASEALDAAAEANAARALLGACAKPPSCGADWLLDPEQKETWEKLQLTGFGMVDAERVRTSLSNDVLLVASSEVQEDHWHTYTVPLPDAFRSGTGSRGIVLSLAFDPPVRSSRRAYLARTMWIEATKGLTLAKLEAYRAKHEGSGEPLRLPAANRLSCRPPRTDLQWSTLQVCRKTWKRAPSLRERDISLVVGCQRRFPHGEGSHQKYSLAVRLWHSDDRVDLYNEVRTRVRRRERARVRRD